MTHLVAEKLAKLLKISIEQAEKIASQLQHKILIDTIASSIKNNKGEIKMSNIEDLKKKQKELEHNKKTIRKTNRGNNAKNR